jgi:hypothetical protein
MTLQQIRDYVRTYMDLDSSDLPNGLIDTWIREGFNRIQNYAVWPWREKQTGATVVNNKVSVFDYQQVREVRIDTRTLKEIPHGAAKARWNENHVSTTTTPSYYSQVGSDLYFWPPAADWIVVYLRGVKAVMPWPISTTAGSAQPPGSDLPFVFLDLLPRWALSSAHVREGDLRTAESLRSEFFDDLEQHKRRMVQLSGSEVFGVGDGWGDSPTWTGRLRYDWE